MTTTTENGRSLSRREWPWLAALVILVSGLYVPQLLMRQTAMEPPEKMDVSSQWYPGYTATGRIYREGIFPLWNPNLYAGMPWAAYSHAGVLYPPNIILFTSFNFFDAVTIAHLLHALLAALGLYLLMREIALAPPAAFLAALVFPSAGFFYYLQSQLSNHAAIAWTPLFLLALARLVRRPRALTFIAAAAITALMVLAGDTEGFVYNTIFAALFLVLFLYRESPMPRAPAAFLAAAALALGLFMSAALVSCLAELSAFSVRSSRSLIPVEFSGLFKSIWPYLPMVLFPFKNYAQMHPIADFNHGLAPFHAGLVPLIGAAAALGLYRRDRRVRALFQIALLMIVLMVLKKTAFLEPVMDRVPVLGRLATPERSLEFVQLMLIIAAAALADQWLRQPAPKSLTAAAIVWLAAGLITLALARWQIETWTRLVLAAALIAAAAGCYDLARRDPIPPRAVTSILIALVIADVYLLALAAAPRADPASYRLDPAVSEFLAESDPDYRHVAFQKIDPQLGQPTITGFVSAETGNDSPFGHMRLPLARYFEFLHLIDPQVAKDWDEVFHGARSRTKLFYTADLYSPAFLDNTNLHLLNLAAVRYVFARDLSFRFSSPFSLMNQEGLLAGGWTETPADEREAGGWRRDQGRWALPVRLPYQTVFETYVLPDTELALELKTGPGGPGLAGLFVELEVSGTEEGGDGLRWTRAVDLRPGDEVPVRLDLGPVSGRRCRFAVSLSSGPAGSEAMIVDARLVRPEAPFQRVAPGPLDIFENTRALPRAFMVHESRALPADELTELMRRPEEFDPGRTVLFETGAVPEGLMELARRGAAAAASDRVEIVTRSSQEARLRTRLAAPGWVVVSDAWHPGWRAWVGREEVRIYRADYVFRAVLVPEGVHEVVFQYRPGCFRVGLWFSLITWVAAFGIGVIVAARRIAPWSEGRPGS